MRYEELTIEGRNAVLEAFRSGKPIDRLFVLDGCQDGPVKTIVREAKKRDTVISFVSRERLDSMSETGHHQGVMAYAAAYEYAHVEDMLKAAEEKGESPFLFLLDLSLIHIYVIIGNVRPELLHYASGLELFQLNSAGADSYTGPGILPEGAVLALSLIHI